MVCCVFLVVHHQSWRLSQTHNFADRQYARIHRAASDMLLVTCKWRYCFRFWAGSWLRVCSSRASGWLTSAAASCVSCSRGREQAAWVQMQLTRKRHFWCFENKRAPLLAAVKGLNTRCARTTQPMYTPCSAPRNCNI